MEERGVVIGCADGIAQVRIERSEACEGCTLCTQSETGDHMIARALDRLGVAPGDRVRIETVGMNHVKASVLLFVLPLAFLFGGYGVGVLVAVMLHLPSAAQPIGAACAVVFFLGSFGLLSFATRGRGGKEASSVIVAKLP
jgi:sigma-E factor negative regulatory protein RseC